MTLAITRSDAMSRIYALSDEINIGAIFAAARRRHCRFGGFLGHFGVSAFTVVASVASLGRGSRGELDFQTGGDVLLRIECRRARVAGRAGRHRRNPADSTTVVTLAHVIARTTDSAAAGATSTPR